MDQRKKAAAEYKDGGEAGMSRQDKARAAIVRKGITLQQIHGTRYAAEFLKEKDIDMEIVMRVLLNLSEQRRHDDFLDVPAAEENDLAQYL